MNDKPQDPYRPFGEPEEPTWGAAPHGDQQPPPPAYQPYAPPPSGAVQPGYPPAPYGYGPPVPQGFGPVAGQYSDKNKTTAGLLQLLLPFVFVCGVGRLFAGHTAIGLIQLIGYFVGLVVFFPIGFGIWFWSVIDGIVILANSNFRDGQGRLMRS